MAKVHPHTQPTSSASCNYMSSTRETFTLWMKSLVFHGNGCTVFNSNGEIVYRVDNYGKKSSNEVDLLDLHGRVLFTIQKKVPKFCISQLVAFGRWEGYKWSSGSKTMDKDQKPFFQVRKSCCKIFKTDAINCQVNVGCDKSSAEGCCKIVGSLARKSTFKIIDNNGNHVAEVTQKQSSSGVVLGNDVLTLVVEPYIDHSFIMALVIVYGLINNQM